MRWLSMPITTVLVTAFVLAPNVRAQSDTATIADLEGKYGAAVQTNDIAFIAGHLAPTYHGIQFDGTIQDRAGLLAARKRNAYKVKSYEVINESESLTGATAVVTKCLRLDYAVDGKQVKGDYEVSRVWQKSGNTWQILLLQMTLRSTPCSK